MPDMATDTSDFATFASFAPARRGDRVRVCLTGGHEVVGTVVRVRVDRMLVAVSWRHRYWVHRDWVEHLELEQVF